MRCCASPTTSTVLDAGRAREPAAREATSREATSREAASQFAALLMNAAFKPLATAMGFYGELVVGAASQTVARGERGGLTDRLERIVSEGANAAATETR